MRAWVLPLVASSFGAGVLVSGDASDPVAGAVLVAAGLVLAVVGSRVRSRRRARSTDMLEGAGLLPVPPEPGPRDRILTGFGIREHGPPAGGSGVATVVALAGFALLGAGWSAVRADMGATPVPRGGRAFRFTGTASSDPRPFPGGWGQEASVAAVDGRNRALGRSFRAWLRGSGRPPSLEAGQPLSGIGIPRDLATPRPGFERYLRDRGVAATIRVLRLQARGPPGNLALRVANAARGGLRVGAERALPGREAGLLLGLAIGDTSRLDRETEEDFRASGLAHLLAVSGSNVAMFLIPILALAGVARLGSRWRFGIGLAWLAFFALVTRWEPSVLRACAMAALVMVGTLAGRPRSSSVLLAGAVLGLLVADPALARASGFQLSVAATAGIVAVAGPLSARLAWLPRPVALATAATVGAQVAVTPLLLLRFGPVPLVSLLANLAALPAVPLALLGGISASVMGLAWDPAGRVVGAVASVPIGYLRWVADRMARAPVARLTWAGAAILACVAVVGAVAIRRRRKGGRALAAIAVLGIAGLVWIAAARAGPPPTLVVTFFDVGQGDAALVRTPEGATVVIDAGPDARVLADRLSALGVRRIDVAVATHAHADHIEGFPAVFARHPVGMLLEPGCPADSPSYVELLRSASDEGVLVRHPRGGERMTLGGLVVEVLGPDGCGLGGDGPNDDSLVLRLRYQDASVLFTGDVEVPSQEDLLADGDPLGAVVLKVPHHGGGTSSEDFFRRVGARLAVVSVGPNDYGHPAPDTLAALRAIGALVVRTDRAGDVTVRFLPEGVVVESAAG